MKNKFKQQINALALLAFFTLSSQLSTAFAQGTAFTYQGRLNDGANPANGNYDLRFSLWNAATSGSSVTGFVTNSPVAVNNGLFTTTIDFGSDVFTGSALWLQIGVRTNGSAGGYYSLTPRQALTPTPYAIYSASAGSAATATTAASVPASAIGSGTANINISGSALSAAYAGLAASATIATTASTAGTATNLMGNVSDAQLSANIARLNGTNTFTGTNMFAGVVIATNVNNVIAGTFTGNGAALTNLNTAQFANSVLTNGQTGVTLGGTFSGSFSGNAGGLVFLNAAALTGSITNINNIYLPGTTASAGAIYSGGTPLIQSFASYGNFFAGLNSLHNSTSGSWNTAIGNWALESDTSGGGNTASGLQALCENMTGWGNTANGLAALFENTSGSYNIAFGYYAGFNITTGSSNIDIGNQGFATDTNIIRIGDQQTQAFIAGVINGNGGGLTNLNASQLTSIGNSNSALGGNFFVGSSGNSTMSGFFNTGYGVEALSANTSGSDNTANGFLALQHNTSGGFNTAVGFDALTFNMTGSHNTAVGRYALILNTNGNYNTAVGSDALYLNTSGSNNIALGYNAGYNITGSSNIDIGNQGFATDTNIIRIGDQQAQAFIAGVINGNGGGLTNLSAANLNGAVPSASLTSVPATNLTGTVPMAQLPSAVVTNNESGVTLNTLTLKGVTQVNSNLCMNDRDVQLRNTYDHGLGWYGSGKPFAGVTVDGPVLYGYGGGILGIVRTGSATNLVVCWNSSGNVGIGTNAPAYPLHMLSGAYCSSAGVWTSVSDRSAKEEFTSIAPAAVLAKVAALPITQWKYKVEPEGVKHLGPVSQDFHAAFGLGDNDKAIGTIDESGVALAAIQGLNEKVEVRSQKAEDSIRKLEAENAELKAQMAELKAFVKQLAQPK